MSRKRGDLGVKWYLPGGKRPIAESTVADADLLRALAADGLTFDEAFNAINYSDEAKAVCEAFIKRGFGAALMTEVGVR